MAINKKLIHFNKKLDFNTRLANNEILDTSIVFIKDTQEIWTHGQLYKCSDPDLSKYLTAEDLNEINNALNATNTELNALKTSVVDLTSDQTISGSKTFTSSKGLTLYNTNASDSELDIYSDASGNKIINNINKGSSTVASGMEINNFTGSTIKIRTYMPGDDVVRAYCTVSPDRSGTICANYLLPNDVRRAAGLFISNGSAERGGATVGVNYGGLVTVYPPDNSDSPTKGVNSVTLLGDVVFRSYKDGLSGGDGNYAWMKYDSDDNFIDIRAVTPSTNTTYETPILINSVKINGERIITECTEITYSELKTRRDNSQLIPGAFYRITDYVTTTSQRDTQSAGHPFDIVVLALTENTLADEAYAVHSERDTDGYFANSNLSAWKIWYSLDNDTAKFLWANRTIGTGVIYRMIDEFNNDIPYDFKNIQVKLNNPIVFCEVSAYGGWYGGKMIRRSEYDKIINDEQYYCWSYETTTGPGYSGICTTKDEQITIDSKLYDPYGSEFSGVRLSSIVNYVYTFGMGESADLSGNCYNNSIGVYINYGNKQELNRITFGNSCYDNSFGNDCRSNSFGSSCHSNTFGNDCYSNTFEDNCSSNSFGDSCHNITSGDSYICNTLGYICCNNTFGDSCQSNTFGDSCQSNTFGNICYHNTFGDNYSFNSIGDNCHYNSFGDNCRYNSFGNDFRYNSFGNDCRNNTFQTDSRTGVEKILDYCYNNHFESGCSYNIICANSTTSSSNKLQNIIIHKGVCGSESKKNYINVDDSFNLNQPYEIQVFNDEGGNICIDTAPVALTTNDIDLIWNEYFGAGGYGGGSASATALDDIINSVGVGDYDEV